MKQIKRYRGPKQEFAVFANRLKMAINKKGINAAQFSEISGVTKGVVSQYLSAAVMPNSDKIVIFAEILNVSPAWLFGADVNPDGTAITETDLFINEDRKALSELVKYGSDEEVKKIVSMWHIMK